MQKIVLMQKLKPTVQFISTEAMFYDFNCSEIESVPVESIVCFLNAREDFVYYVHLH